MRTAHLFQARLFPFAAAAFAAALTLAAPARAEEGEISYPKQNWSFNGPFGTFDRASAQRGFQVYKDVCATCHSLQQMAYRALSGIGIEPSAIAAIAGSVSVPALTDDGQPTERPALPSDRFRSPFPNDRAARAANNGALPPDLSVIEKAREGGADYLFALLTGFRDPPPGFKLGDGMNYNTAFAGHQIGMPPPLHDEGVTYADGTKATVEQQARDVTTFLAFAANPEMESRKRIGVRVILFLVVLTGLTYAVKRKVWADVDH